MSSDGSIVIDVTLDTEKLAASLAALNDTVSAGAKNAGAGMERALSQAVDGACAGAAEAASRQDLAYIGNMLAEGLAGGIRSAAQTAVTAAQTMIENVKSVIASGVQVHSPSKWAEGVGGFIGEGLANGVDGSSGLVNEAAGRLIKGFTDTVEEQAQDAAKAEIAALDSVIAAEKAALEERARIRELEQRQNAVDIAVDADVKRRAIEYLSDTERRHALEDLEEYRRVLAERERSLEEYKQAQIRALEDVSYKEREYAYGDYELKVKLYDDEYLAKISRIDEGLYAFLSAQNAEMEAVIERIALEDGATAERLAAILEEKNAIIEKSRIEKELREEKLREEQEQELLRRVLEAETVEESIKRTEEYNKWREEQEYKLAESGRQAKLTALDSEYKAIIETVRKAQEEIDAIRKEGEAAVSSAAEAMRSGGPAVDLDGEKEVLGLSSEQQAEYYANALVMAQKSYTESLAKQTEHYSAVLSETQKYYAQRRAAVERETASEYSLLQAFNNNVVSMFLSYAPLWYEAGAQVMSGLYNGLMSRFYEVSSLVYTIQSMLSSVSLYGGGDYYGDYYPMYGTGGVVTTPRLAIVGDVPEAIIPLSKLDEIIRQSAYIAAPAMAAAPAGSVAAVQQKNVTVNQTNNIYQPVNSPAETARAIKRMSREMARGY